MPRSKTAADSPLCSVMTHSSGCAAAPAPSLDAAPHRGRRATISGLGAASLLLVAVGLGDAVAGDVLRLRCTNPASGANWPIVIDLDRGRVDSLAATISDKWIDWHDPERGFFELERASGRLQLRNASATGGYFLYYQCRPE